MYKKQLSEGQVRELVMKTKAGSEEAGNKLALYFEGIAKALAYKFRSSYGHTVDDMVQVAYIGLMKAVERFDPVKYPDIPFIGFAKRLAFGEIQRWHRDKKMIRPSRNIHEMATVLQRKGVQYLPIDDIMQSLGLDESERNVLIEALVYLQRGGGTADSTDRTIYRDKDGKEDGGYLDTFQGDINSEHWFDFIVLREALERLEDDREKTVIKMRFFEDMSQQEIADKLGVSQMSISRVERRAIKRLSKYLQSDEQVEGIMYLNKKEALPRAAVSFTAKQKQREEVMNLLRTGEFTQKEISERTGMKESSVWYYAQKVKKEKGIKRYARAKVGAR